MDKNLYSYMAKLYRVIDGDTIEVAIDLGFDVCTVQTVRIARINAPEVRTLRLLEKRAGLKVADYVEKQLSGKDLYLKTYKGKSSDKYGRYLAEINVETVESVYNLSSQLITMGFAQDYDGTAKKEWTDDELTQIVNFVV
jgi:micrococcal nuclease